MLVTAKRVTNFGRNVDFVPAAMYAPRSESEVLEILGRHRGERIRCIGSGHSWSRIFATEGVLLDLRYLNGVTLIAPAPQARVRVGGGCTLQRLLDALRRDGLTLPTLGAILKQTVAGATSTGTHGSGSNSLSHFIEEARIATFDPQTREPAVVTLRGGPELLAARCALGALGVVLEVVLRAVPAYRVEEQLRRIASLEEVMRGRQEWPLQQFALVPWTWNYLVYRRRRASRGGSLIFALLCRALVFVFMDVGLHLLLKLNLRLLSDRSIRGFYRHVLPHFPLIPDRIDDSKWVLTLRHDLFRHVEMELFVPESQFPAAAATARELIEIASGERSECPAPLASALRDEVLELRGTWTHHYPLLCRRVLAEETLVSMACAGVPPEAAWISISFFTYRRVDDSFARFARTVARCLVELHGARLHWGKYFPIPFGAASAAYPRFQEFREVCLRYDPAGAFWNESF